jgi:hypothetical protein
MRNMRVIVSIALASVVAGCAVPEPQRPPAVVDTKAPICDGKMDCEAKWLKAQERIQMLTGMKLRIVTESRLETFSPTTAGRLLGVVTKFPVSNSAYELRVELSCYHHTMDCRDLQARGTNLFNMTVGP